MLLAEYLTSVYVPGHLGIAREYVRQIAIAVQLFSRWLGHDARSSEFSDDLLARFLAAYLDGGVSRATVNAKRRFLLALWRDAADHGKASPPLKPPKRLREQLPLPEAWTLAELERILRVMGGMLGQVAGLPARSWWLSLALTIYDCGCRIGAARQVTPGDISLERCGLVLRAEGAKTGIALWHNLSEQTMKAIKAIYSPSRTLMWPWPYSREALDNALRRILDAAGVRYGRGAGGLWHKLRKTSGTLVEVNGGDGARHLGNTRAVFQQHYFDPRLGVRSQVDRLPRPTF